VNVQHKNQREIYIREIYIYQANLAIPRLERIAPDSSWAHRATGVRRTLLRLIDEHPPDNERLHAVLLQGFDLLEKAAKDKVR
jgi:hypothetical protein